MSDKSNLNTTDYSILQEKLNDFEMIFQQMLRIDRAQNEQELKAATKALIHAIGDYTQADRVYVFDLDPSSDTYSNTFEWCAPGVLSWLDDLQSIPISAMPYWHSSFLKGESIIIDNTNDIKDIMPNEYQLLIDQDIHTELAFPMYFKEHLFGFIGLDDPQLAKFQTFISLLAVVGGHLGNARENLRIASLLKQQQGNLQKSNDELEKEKLYLSILCIDYTSVYCVDLEHGTMEIIKLDHSSNAAKGNYFSTNRIMKYSDIIADYYRRFVPPASSPDFLEKLSIANIKKELTGHDRFIYHYRSIPNINGQEYFEMQVVPLTDDPDHSKVIMGFRHIDSIVKEEQAQKRKLQKALDEANLNNEIISAISKVYFAIYRISLQDDFYEEISSDSEVHRLTGRIGKASAKMIELCQTFVAPDYQDQVMKFFDLSTLPSRLKNDEIVDMDYLAKDGNWHLARFIVKKRDTAGNVTHVLYVTRLISDQKRREQNWIFMAEEANRANAAKSDFLSRIAHDIRTPMNAVLGFVNITRKYMDDPAKVNDGLNKIQLAGTYIEQLVNDILDIASIENGKMELHPEETNIIDIFNTFSNNIDLVQAQKKLNYSCIKHDIIHELLYADSLRLKQIYMNLLSNAIKYTPEGGKVTLEIFEAPASDTGKIKLISIISDTGIGMSSEFIPKMYQKFEREVDTRVNQARGSGLGLPIVKHLVDLMNGTIDVQTAPGKGTTFRIELEFPYIETSVEATDVEKDLAVISCKGMHLLIAEDNDLNYEVVSELLHMNGITCTRAENGAVCVNLFRSAPIGTYDAILMDMQMPVMNGLDASAAIRNLDRRDAAAIPIIALTANAFTKDIKQYLANGINDHLSKPLDIHQLMTVLIKYKK